MASALAKGIIRAGLASPKQIIPRATPTSAAAVFQKETGCRTTTSNSEVLASGSMVILAVKPDQVPVVLNEVRDQFTSDHLLISIAAGIRLATLESSLGAEARVIRVMPNTPALVGAPRRPTHWARPPSRVTASSPKNCSPQLGSLLNLKKHCWMRSRG